MSRVVRCILAAGMILTLLAAALVYLVLSGTILLNNPSRELYPVRGVDVSHWQGEIDWDVLAEQDLSFAFIKATEGSTFADSRFIANWTQAQQTDLRIGAYHFFSFDSPGQTQAENFISNVNPHESMLPPIIDVEFYGDKAKNPPSADLVRAELDILVSALRAHYGMNPILYSTQSAYNLYIAGAYENCDIWIRDIIFQPKLSDERNWTFWQYTDRETLPGYSGEEKFIDMNVFHGSAEEFEYYGR